MLSSLHEVLLRICTIKYENTYDEDDRTTIKFSDFVNTLSRDTNNDEVS